MFHMWHTGKVFFIKLAAFSVHVTQTSHVLHYIVLSFLTACQLSSIGHLTPCQLSSIGHLEPSNPARDFISQMQ